MSISTPHAKPRLVAISSEADLPTEDLVARAARGESWAREMLVRRHYAWLLNASRRLLGNSADAEDVAQESFAMAFQSLGDLRNPAAFRAWLLQIAVRNVQARFRQRKWLRFFGFGTAEAQEFGLASMVSQDASPEDLTELALVDEVLKTLPSEERMAWSLRCIEGLKLEDVAAACKCSLATAKRRILSAETALRAHVSFEDSDTRSGVNRFGERTRSGGHPARGGVK